MSWQGRTTSGFSEGDPKYYRCGCHIRKTTVVFSSAMLFLCVVTVAFCVAALALPDSYTYLGSEAIDSVYKNNKDTFLLAYRITLGVLITGFLVHCLTVSLALVGVYKVEPSLMVAELLVMGLLIGVLLFVTVSLVIFMVIMSRFVWFLCVADSAFVLLSVTSMYTLILCYRYLKDKKKSWRRSLAGSRTVRFTR